MVNHNCQVDWTKLVTFAMNCNSPFGILADVKESVKNAIAGCWSINKE